jgi:hypothetical protein
MTDQTLYYLGLNGAAQGPFSGETVTSMFRAGTVPPDTLTCPVGGAAWLPLHQFPQLIAPPAPPPPPPSPVVPPPLAPFPPVAAAAPLPAPPATGYGAPPPATGYGAPQPAGPDPMAPEGESVAGAPPESATLQAPSDGTKGIRISAIIAAMVCFFLPWLEFQCSGQRLISQTGLQTVLNKGTVDQEFVRQMQAMAGARGQQLPTEMKDDKMMDEAGPAWLTGIAMFMAVLALFAAFGSDGRATSGLFAALAAGILVFNAITGFPMEDAIKKQMEGASGRGGGREEQMGRSMAGKMFKVVYTPWFYVTTGALAAAALLGLSGGSGARRR